MRSQNQHNPSPLNITSTNSASQCREEYWTWIVYTPGWGIVTVYEVSVVVPLTPIEGTVTIYHPEGAEDGGVQVTSTAVKLTCSALKSFTRAPT